VLYNGSSNGAQLPYYVPSSTGAAGTVGYVSLTGSSAITAPVAGAFTPDDSIFFVSTAGDNKIHYLRIPADPSTTAPTDTQQISPNLPACTPVSAGGQDAGCTSTGSGTVAPATAIAVAPRSTT
jgi:trimeric autotransporter adhesin